MAPFADVLSEILNIGEEKRQKRRDFLAWGFRMLKAFITIA